MDMVDLREAKPGDLLFTDKCTYLRYVDYRPGDLFPHVIEYLDDALAFAGVHSASSEMSLGTRLDNGKVAHKEVATDQNVIAIVRQ